MKIRINPKVTCIQSNVSNEIVQIFLCYFSVKVITSNVVGNESVQDSVLDYAAQDARNAEEQRNNEIRASIRSLKTNLMITLVIIVSAILIEPLPQYAKAYVISFVKAASPVITMVANFGKVQEFLLDLKENFRLKCCGQEV